MPKVMKVDANWDENDTDTGGNYYDGPPPPAGLYKGKVARIYLHKVAEGPKKGEIRWHVICEITEGKYKGAGVSKWLQLTEQGRPWVHQFLHSLTDGSEAQCAGIRKAFKEVGYAVDDPDDKKRLPVVRIGKKFNPIGQEVNFLVRVRIPDGETEARHEISRFVSKRASDDDDDDDTGTDGDYSPEDMLSADDDSGDVQDLDSGDSSDASDSTEEPDPGDNTEETESSEEAAPSSSDDDDDPWSV